MKAILILAVFGLAVGCVDAPVSSTAEQQICTAEDWEIGNCPDSAWRIAYTRDRAVQVDPAFATVEGANCYTEPVTWCCLTGASIVFTCTWNTNGTVTCY